MWRNCGRAKAWHGPRTCAETERPSGRFAAFSGPVFAPPDTDTLEGKTAPQTPPYGLAGLFRGRTIHPRYSALETLHASTRRPTRPGQTPPERTQPPPTRHPEPARNAKRPPPRRVPPSEGLKVGKVGKSKVVSRKSKVESRLGKSESRSRKSETARKVAKVACFLKVGSRNKRRNAPQSRCKRF